MRVYWKETSKETAWVGSYKHPITGAWKTKSIPVSIAGTKEHQTAASLYFADWYKIEFEGKEGEAAPVKTIASLKDKFDAYSKKHHNEEVYNQCERHIRKIFLTAEFNFNDKQIKLSELDIEKDFSIPLCRSFLRSLSGAPLTQRNILQSITIYFHIAMAEGWINLTANPFREKTVREINKEPKKIAQDVNICLDKSQTEQLLNFPLQQQQRSARNFVAIYLGLRDGELNGLQWGDIKNNIVHIQRQLKKTSPLTFALPKRNKTRKLPIHSQLQKPLQFWKETWTSQFKRAPTDTDPVFPSKDGNFFQPNSARAFRDDLARAGLPTMYERQFPFDAHATRRTFMTLLAAAGVPDLERRRLMGHSGKDVGERNYIGELTAHLATEIEKLQLRLEVLGEPQKGSNP